MVSLAIENRLRGDLAVCVRNLSVFGQDALYHVSVCVQRTHFRISLVWAMKMSCLSVSHAGFGFQANMFPRADFAAEKECFASKLGPAGTTD
jgi:hypothetical protein